jgi:hypothetical protein
VVKKCERCDAVLGDKPGSWCEMCGFGSPAEVEQRQRAEKANYFSTKFNR